MLVVQNLSDENFIGLNSIEKEFKSWDWIFGRNPPFSIVEFGGNNEEIAKLSVDKGIVIDHKCHDRERFNNWSRLLSFSDQFSISLCKELFLSGFNESSSQCTYEGERIN